MTKQTFRNYYTLTKPGIVYGNIMTTAAAGLFALSFLSDIGSIAAAVIGTALIIAGACVTNNITDRAIDIKMKRTKKRALVQGSISVKSAVLYAACLTISGFILLGLLTNMLTVTIGVIGFIDYTILYGLAKRYTVHGTLVGSICGATPMLAGYCAVTDRFDVAAAILFLIMVFWQMVHFYAIAMYRSKEYAAAGIPVLPVAGTIEQTKLQMFIYSLCFVVAVAALSLTGHAPIAFGVVMTALALRWSWLCWQGRQRQDHDAWARQQFGFSLKILLALSVSLSLSGALTS